MAPSPDDPAEVHDASPKVAPPESGAGAHSLERERSTLDEVADEDRDSSWGDEPSGRDDEWYRRERPPHHG